MDDIKTEETEETVDESQAENYTAGEGNSILDSLYATEIGEARPEQEPTEVPAVEEVAGGDRPVSSVAMSLTDSLADLAEAPAEEPEPEPEPKVAPEVEPESEEAPHKEDLDVGDYYTSVATDFDQPEVPYDADQYNPDAGLNLSDDDQDEVHLARVAAHLSPSLKGLDKKFVDFYEKKKEFITKSSEEDPSFEASMDNMEYAEFISKNRPKFSDAQRRKAEREIDKQDILAQTSLKLNQVERRHQQAQLAPRIQQRAENFRKDVLVTVVPDELKQAIDSEGVESVRSKHAFEMRAIEENVQLANHYGSTFLQLSNHLIQYDENDSSHKEISEFVHQQGEIFAKQGGKDRIRGDKKFVPRDSYHKIQADKRDQYWTFSDDEILEMMKFFTKNQVDAQLNSLKEQLAGYGANGSVAPSPPPEPSPEPAPAPKAKTTKSTGATSSMENASESVNPIISSLGI